MKERGKIFLLVLVGAFIGSDLRYLESLIFKTTNGFPLGTLVANLAGAFIMPFLIHYLQDRYNLSSKVILTLSTGLLGSYTTFSTFTADSYRLYQSGNWVSLLIYLTITILGGFVVAILGNYWAASRAFNDYVKKEQDR